MAPEILPAWALSQRLAAKTVRDMYNSKIGMLQTSSERVLSKTKDRIYAGEVWDLEDREEMVFIVRNHGGCESRWVFEWNLWLRNLKGLAVWTLKHGHFLIMGGFHVVEPSGRVTILTLEMLRKLLEDPTFEIQTTEEEIADKSKGDALSKIIFIMQSTWFILNCLGRLAQGLDLTHLELTTVALASLNGITFVLWWHKPLGAQAVVRVCIGRNLTDAERNDATATEEVGTYFFTYFYF